MQNHSPPVYAVYIAYFQPHNEKYIFSTRKNPHRSRTGVLGRRSSFEYHLISRTMLPRNTQHNTHIPTLLLVCRMTTKTTVLTGVATRAFSAFKLECVRQEHANSKWWYAYIYSSTYSTRHLVGFSWAAESDIIAPLSCDLFFVRAFDLICFPVERGAQVRIFKDAMSV